MKEKNVLQSARVLEELRRCANEDRRLRTMRFFKTSPGEYAEHDKFIGVSVPDIRKVMKGFGFLSYDDLAEMLASRWHEMRFAALVSLVDQVKGIVGNRRRDKAIQEKGREDEVLHDIYRFYLSHSSYVNNWDLVDLSAPWIVGEYLCGKSKEPLFFLAGSSNMWENRIAMVATLGLMRHGECDTTYVLAEKLLDHPHDLMKKAVGWMLREAGKRDENRLCDFLVQHKSSMSRVTLRYAIERFDEPMRMALLS